VVSELLISEQLLLVTADLLRSAAASRLIMNRWLDPRLRKSLVLGLTLTAASQLLLPADQEISKPCRQEML